MQETISILGCGWFGLPFGKQLSDKGFVVKGSATSLQKRAALTEAGIIPFLLDVTHPETYTLSASFFNCDVLLLSIPPGKYSAAAGTFTTAIQLLMTAIEQYQVKKLILISSTGVYGNVYDAVDETTLPVPETVAGQQLLAAETTFCQSAAFKTSVVRFAGLVGPGRDPGRFLAGKTNLENGGAPVNLLHLEDAMGICLAIIARDLFGYTVNACTPDHPTRKDFYTLAAGKSGLPPPVFAAGTHQGKTINSIYTKEVLHYSFKINNWLEWLKTGKV